MDSGSVRKGKLKMLFAEERGLQIPKKYSVIDINQLSALTTLSVSTLKRYARHGQIPKPIKFNRNNYWEYMSVYTFMQNITEQNGSF